MSALEDTTEILLPSGARGTKVPAAYAAVTVDVASLSHPGAVRKNNEDHFLVTRFGRYLEALQTNLEDELRGRFDETGFAFAIADGMGGHAAGEKASALALHALLDLALHTPDWILRFDDDAYVQKVLERAKERFEQANQRLVHEAEVDPSIRGLGTTLTLAWSIGRNLFVANVGDSRAYLLRDKRLQQLTHDHTVAQQLADEGLIDQSEVALHRWRNHLTRLLGGIDADAEPDVHRYYLCDGDWLLLCSDGLTDMVDEPVIAQTLVVESKPMNVCERLIELALAAGGRDNITVIAVQYRCQEAAAGAQLKIA